MIYLTMQGRLVEKIWRYLSAAATRHTAVAKAFSAHNAKSTFWKRENFMVCRGILQSNIFPNLTQL